MGSKVNKQNLIIGRRIFNTLITLLLLLLALYIYFVSSSIVNVLVREEIEHDIVLLDSEVSGLESEYLTIKNKVTLAYAHSLGFKDVTNKHFVSRASIAGRGLTVNNQ